MDRREALKALVALPATARISVAQLQPDDVIVIEVDESITQEHAANIKAQMGRVWPWRQVVVLGKGMTLKVMAGV